MPDRGYFRVDEKTGQEFFEATGEDAMVIVRYCARKAWNAREDGIYCRWSNKLQRMERGEERKFVSFKCPPGTIAWSRNPRPRYF